MSSVLSIEIEQLEREAKSLREAIAPLALQLEKCEFRLVRKRLERGLTAAEPCRWVRVLSDDGNGEDEHISDYARGYFGNS